MLRDDPARGVTSENPIDALGGLGYGAVTGPAQNQRDFCLDCHGGISRYTSGVRTPMSREDFAIIFPVCAECHSSREHFGVDANPESGNPSHPMTPEPSPGFAWKPSAFQEEGGAKERNSCILCHDSLQDFPHVSPDPFFISGYGEGEDALCGRCHTDTGFFPTATEGVGITY
jgi:hypothetical protein